jgi:16S rRNA (adenine1518-N6/adenine1519-N6)-dimethyltransferase
MTLPPVAEHVARHGIAADKRLGQHFLFDLNLTARIARAAGNLAQGTTFEVGPGPGGLTCALLEQGANVVAIERDKRLEPLLAEIAAASAGKLTVMWADALTADLATLGDAPRRIVANLPYNVGTELLMRWLEQAKAFEAITVMLQSEVVDRLCATPGSGDYGRLSVRAQWLCRIERLFTVHPRAFVPPPAVESAVVQLVPRATPLAPADDKTLQRVTAAAFGQRRKMLRQSLKSLATSTGFADGTELCVKAAIEPTARAETLSVEDFCRLARIVAASG